MTEPTIQETTFGGYVATVYGYPTREAINPEDAAVLEMVNWTMDDPKGPRIGWGERIFVWQNADECEQIWRHKPEPADLDEHGDLLDAAIERRGR